MKPEQDNRDKETIRKDFLKLIQEARSGGFHMRKSESIIRDADKLIEESENLDVPERCPCAIAPIIEEPSANE